MSFGADTDYWGFGDTNWKLLRCSQSPSNSGAQARDSKGDVQAETRYDSTTVTTCEYGLSAPATLQIYDTTTAIDFRLGKVISSKVITNLALVTSNTDYPKLTITGENTSAADSDVPHYTPPTMDGLSLTRKAIAIGASVDTVSKLTGSSATASVEIAKLLDSTGAEAAKEGYGGRIEASNEFVGVTGAPGAAADTGWVASSGPDDGRTNTEYGTGSITVFKNITQDA